MQDIFEINNYDNHIIVEKNGKLLLIDTGSPSSMGVTPDLELCGQMFNNVGKNIMGYSIQKLTDDLGIEVDFLIGNDILSRFNIQISLKRNQLIITDEKLKDYQDDSNLNNNVFFMGAPALKFSTGGNVFSAIYDTGAKISYFSSNLVSGLNIIGEINDFNPMLGKFTSSKYNLELSFNEHKVSFPGGKSPDLLEMTLSLIGISAVIGNHLLEQFDIYIEYDTQCVYLIKV